MKVLYKNYKKPTTYQALPLPMPQLDDVDAIMWEIEAEYLADSEDALITWGQMDS